MLPAAHPHTEFKTIRTVPSVLMALVTRSAVVVSSKPIFDNSARIGATNSGGYIIYLFCKVTSNQQSIM
jgi:hypothetical protein